MKYVVRGIVLPIHHREADLVKKIAKETRTEPKYFSYYVLRKSIDARKGEVNFVYSVVIDSSFYMKGRNVFPYEEPKTLIIPKSQLNNRPVVVGFGPAGMFAALLLARSGAKPIVLERGKSVEKRNKDIERLKRDGVLDENSNVCYGEGGAGTFSDGKLNTGVNDERTRFVLEEFVKHGAKKDILVDALPHIGSDYLQNVVKNFREEILSLGGDILFESCLSSLLVKSGRLVGLKYFSEGSERAIETSHLVLAIGHSPFDTVSALVKSGLFVAPKDFSIGVRIEHLQSAINQTRYHSFSLDPLLPAASYKCVTHLKSGRALYSFCMCPGGHVMNSSTEKNTIVTNGMSNNSRSGINGNSALLVPVKISDYFRNSPLDGFVFRRAIEQSAFLKEKPYFAPVQLVGDFLNGQKGDSIKSIQPTYAPGVYFSSLDRYLPSFVSSSLKEGILALGEQLSFMADKDAVMTGFETRSSSPIRIPRDSSLQSNIAGVYPCGEGASYAGGITSAALDGIKVALAILS